MKNPPEPDREFTEITAEELGQALRDVFDLIDEEIDGITDEDTDLQLRQVLDSAGYDLPDGTEGTFAAASVNPGPPTATGGLTSALAGHADEVDALEQARWLLRAVREEAAAAEARVAAAYQEAELQTAIAGAAVRSAAEARAQAARLIAHADTYLDTMLERAATITKGARQQAQQIIAQAEQRAEDILASARSRAGFPATLHSPAETRVGNGLAQIQYTEKVRSAVARRHSREAHHDHLSALPSVTLCRARVSRARHASATEAADHHRAWRTTFLDEYVSCWRIGRTLVRVAESSDNLHTVADDFWAAIMSGRRLHHADRSARVSRAHVHAVARWMRLSYLSDNGRDANHRTWIQAEQVWQGCKFCDHYPVGGLERRLLGAVESTARDIGRRPGIDRPTRFTILVHLETLSLPAREPELSSDGVGAEASDADARQSPQDTLLGLPPSAAW